MKKPRSTPAVKPSPAEPPPAPGAVDFPVVGIGASAGGLAAFEAFFSGLPPSKDPDMAFVLVQHLAPDHKSLLTELIRRATRMEVFEVENALPVRRNCVYIIPPGQDMELRDGALNLLKPTEPHGRRLPIDFFFQSLAQEQGDRAIGIILSGTGADGTQGLRAIKAAGGMVMAQTLASTEFDGMPRSAIDTGLVDYELAPSAMPARLIAYAKRAFAAEPLPERKETPRDSNALKKIFAFLRTQTGHDFSHYKPSTILRRIDRRMAVHQIATRADYAQFLQRTPTETEALFRELLIGVTLFFRDREAFAELETRVIPRLFEGRPAGSVVRVWSAGCSTGEEAYSLAMLLQERMDRLKKSFQVQVFATDIDSRAIATARAGFYPASITADVSPERMARFFTAEADGSGFRVKKSLRDLLIFSEQDVIKDPPFSRLNLISCRNLLIYLDVELQRKLIPLFHYALLPGGALFLGTSEGIGDFGDLFAVLDRKAKLYLRKDHYAGLIRSALGRMQLPTPSMPVPASRPHEALKPRPPAKSSLREITEQTLLQHLTSAGVLVNERGDILYLHGRAGRYLEPAPGETGISNVLKMAREGLRRALVTGLRLAVETKRPTQAPGLQVRTNGHVDTVHLHIRPVTVVTAIPPESPLYLIILDPAGSVELPPAAADPTVEGGPAAEARITSLLQELRAKDEFLQSTLEELESSNEELKSSNEEMQSVNEELQSTNEELETSKEEMQSINEELTTVNGELHAKVADLSRANNDMNNLLAGTGIATVFVDHQLRILRFTPAVSKIIPLIPGDVGRPVAHLASNLTVYESLVADVQAVLTTLVPKELEVTTLDGAVYAMRIQPYRTQDNVIEGAVISFIDISEAVRTREALKKANDLLRLAVVVRDAQDAITMHDLQGRTLAWNPGATRLYGWTEAEALTLNVRDRIPPALRPKVRAPLLPPGPPDEPLVPEITERLTKSGARVKVAITTSALLDPDGEIYALATTERPIPGGA